MTTLFEGFGLISPFARLSPRPSIANVPTTTCQCSLLIPRRGRIVVGVERSAFILSSFDGDDDVHSYHCDWQQPKIMPGCSRAHSWRSDGHPLHMMWEGERGGQRQHTAGTVRAGFVKEAEPLLGPDLTRPFTVAARPAMSTVFLLMRLKKAEQRHLNRLELSCVRSPSI